jgi:hypothetical protein
LRPFSLEDLQMTRTSDAPTGETSAKYRQGRKEQSNFADITNAMTDPHEHHPRLSQLDRAVLNDKLLDQGVLPHFHLV